MRVIFYRPVNRIARESVLAGERRNVTIGYPAQPTFGRNPQSSTRPEANVIDSACAEAIARRVCLLNLPIREVDEAPLPKTEPEPLLRRISLHYEGVILMTKFGPGNFFNHSSVE